MEIVLSDPLRLMSSEIGFPNAPDAPSILLFPRDRNALIQEESIFIRGSAAYDEEGPIKMSHLPKLIAVAMENEKGVLRVARTDDHALRRMVERITATLHPQGTVVFGLPRPSWTALTRLGGEVVEQCRYVTIADDCFLSPIVRSPSSVLV